MCYWTLALVIFVIGRRARSELNAKALRVILIEFAASATSTAARPLQKLPKAKTAAEHSRARADSRQSSDGLLDYEEETEINESDSPHQSVTKLLDNSELLQELAPHATHSRIPQNKCITISKAALTKDGEVDVDDDTVDQKQRYTPADRRAYAEGFEVLCSTRCLGAAILKACAGDDACWALLTDCSPVATMRDARWARIWLRMLEVK